MRAKLVIASFLLIQVIEVFAQGIGGTHSLTKVADGIYTAVPKFGGANATIILDEDSVVIVDSHSSPAAAGALISEVRALTDKPVRHVINTHWHGDHHGGNQAFYDAFDENIMFISHENTREEIATSATEELRRMASFYSNFYKRAEESLATSGENLTSAQTEQIETYIEDEIAFVADAQSYEYLLPTMTITESLTLYTRNREIQLLFYQKAHTRGDLVVFLPRERVLIAGDLLTAPYIVPRSGYPKEYAKTLRQVAELDFDRYVLGHGGPVKNDKSFVLLMAEFLEAVVEHAEKTSGVSFDESLMQVNMNTKLQEFEKRINWDEAGLRFLDFGGLIQMTLNRAHQEANGLL